MNTVLLSIQYKCKYEDLIDYLASCDDVGLIREVKTLGGF